MPTRPNGPDRGCYSVRKRGNRIPSPHYNPMTLETRIVRQAISRLQEDGYVLVSCHDGHDRYSVPQGTTPLAALNAAMDAVLGTDFAHYFLEKPGLRCALTAVWGNGEDVISDYSASSDAEMDRIEDLILA